MQGGPEATRADGAIHASPDASSTQAQGLSSYAGNRYRAESIAPKDRTGAEMLAGQQRSPTAYQNPNADYGVGGRSKARADTLCARHFPDQWAQKSETEERDWRGQNVKREECLLAQVPVCGLRSTLLGWPASDGRIERARMYTLQQQGVALQSLGNLLAGPLPLTREAEGAYGNAVATFDASSAD